MLSFCDNTEEHNYYGTSAWSIEALFTEGVQMYIDGRVAFSCKVIPTKYGCMVEGYIFWDVAGGTQIEMGICTSSNQVIGTSSYSHSLHLKMMDISKEETKA